ENMLVGMEEYLKPEISEAAAEVRRKIRVEATDLPALLVDFLNHCLYLIQTNKETYQKVRFNKFSDMELEADLAGQSAERFEEDIKAATYHELEVKEAFGGKWEAVVLFDV
ncbi:MAG: archease, partial [Candidatus Nealsonbacteria bacterium]|nr:archease [Candidatus Nealsonbacteria bacterium]